MIGLIITLLLAILTLISFPLFWSRIYNYGQKHLGHYFIKDTAIKKYIFIAKKEIKKKNYKNSFVNMTKAFNVFIAIVKKQYKNITMGWIIVIDSVEKMVEKGLLTLDLLEYKKFNQWAPHIITFENGSQQVILKRSYTTEDTSLNAKHCLGFVIKSILVNQSKF